MLGDEEYDDEVDGDYENEPGPTMMKSTLVSDSTKMTSIPVACLSTILRCVGTHNGVWLGVLRLRKTNWKVTCISRAGLRWSNVMMGLGVLRS